MLKVLNDIFRDTLKVKEKEADNTVKLKWSKTNLTMFTAFAIGCFMAVYDFFKTGFNFQVFLVYISMAIGMKGVSILGKKFIH